MKGATYNIRPTGIWQNGLTYAFPEKMNFFEAQERARRTSMLLLPLFALAVLGVIICLYPFVHFFMNWISEILYDQKPEEGILKYRERWDLELFLWTAAIAGGLISFGSLYKNHQFAAGGKVLALDLGGRLVEPSTSDIEELRLLNVVEEMAIASGLPVPQVWILHREEAINAFCAGTDPSNAVLGVTRGCLKHLSRDELQAVVGHELSHILNGDMRLNLKLTGWVFGLVMVSVLGKSLMRPVSVLEYDDDNGGALLIVPLFLLILLGLPIYLVGSVGVLFARILQAGISSQREYLADASAVQFTRNAESVVNALKKVAGSTLAGELRCPLAMEARHIFFTGSTSSFFLRTHPPLEKRIRAIEPKWDGETPTVEIDVYISDEDALYQKYRRSNLSEAKRLLFSLLVGSDPHSREQACEILKRVDGGGVGEIMGYADDLKARSGTEKLTLIDLSLPWLKKMGRNEAVAFVKTCQQLIHADGEVELFEFTLEKIIERNVLIGTGQEDRPSIRYWKLEDVKDETAAVLNVIASLNDDPNSLEEAKSEFRQHGIGELLEKEVSLQEFSAALKRIDSAVPLVKQQILRLCRLAVMQDGLLDIDERVLLRAIAEAIGVPLPPFANGIF